MENIKPLIKDLPVDLARFSLYYLSRYLKQAGSMEEYQKDIFEDEEHNTPSEAVRDLTLNLINFIEQAEGMKAKDFDDATYSAWNDQITSIESELDEGLSEEEIKRAQNFLSSMSTPSLQIRK